METKTNEANSAEAMSARRAMRMEPAEVLAMRLVRAEAVAVAAKAETAQLRVQLLDAQIVATYDAKARNEVPRSGSVDLDKGTITLDAPRAAATNGAPT